MGPEVTSIYHLGWEGGGGEGEGGGGLCITRARAELGLAWVGQEKGNYRASMHN